jgi:ligand-binding sensor domain-containing protein
VNTTARKISLRLFCILLLLQGIAATAQTYNFRNYSVEDGLAFINVSAIYQDSSGYLWCGGYGGVSRFDGFTFTNFGPRDGLANNAVSCITQDRQGAIWFGTIGGLSCFRDNRFTSYTRKEGLAGDKVNALFVDNENRVWIGTRNGLSIFDGESFETPELKGIFNRNVVAIVRDSYYRIWIATDKALFRLRKQGNTFAADISEEFPEGIASLGIDKEDRLWIGTASGVIRYSDGRRETFLEGSYVGTILRTSDNHLWFGTGKGVVSYNGKDFSIYKIRNDQNSNLVAALFEDREQNLWLGTYSGLFRYRGTAFLTYAAGDGLSNSFVYGMHRDSSGLLWIGTGDGLFNYDGTRFSYNKANSLAGKRVCSVLGDSSGRVWAGSSNGLYCYEKGSCRRFSDKEGLISDSIIVLYRDKRNNMWIGCHKGVSVYDGSTFRNYNFDPENQDYEVSSILEDRSGAVWLGSYQGKLFRYEKGKFEDFGKKTGMKSTAYMALLEGRQGTVYIGTFDGLFVYSEGKWTQIREEQGLSSDLIYSMAFDATGNYLWIGTNQGVNRLDVNEYRKSRKVVIQSYSKEDGFQGVETNSNSAFLDRDGSLWFGTVNGLVHYRPDDYRPNRAEPKINLRRVMLFEKDTLLSSGSRLSYRENNLSFEFVGISLTNPQKVRYRYFLEGFDKTWSEETRLNAVKYSNLPPGSYVFRVRSCNNEGLWSRDAALLSFSVAAPFWKTWWFRLLFSAVVIALVVMLVKLRIREIRRKERARLRQKMDLMDYQLKALRAQMNPHFIFNSLNSIQNFIMDQDESSANKYLNKFSKLMRMILNNSERPTITVREELDALGLYLELEQMRFGNRFRYSISVSEEVNQEFFEMPSMLLQPYIENALLHGIMPKKGEGRLEIRMETRNGYLVSTIQDNGIGRKRSQELKEKSTSHKSVGMKITQERLQMLNEMHNSMLSVTITDLLDEQKNSAGTKVEIYIPLT